jgi:antitoxin component of RelBE/YafQ-DinJ toxin-antitoxin module
MKSTMVSLRMPQDLIREAKRKAKQLDRPLSQVVRELLRTWIAEQSQPVQALK